MMTPESFLQNCGQPFAPTTFETEQGETVTIPGASLRDVFALVAMHAFLVSDTNMTMPVTTVTRSAYELADAMLEARVK